MDLYSISVKDIYGQEQTLEKYRGMVILIVNTAGECGCTHQYEGLQRLYERYHEDGFVVLGFPCNQFGGQEPGDEEEILNFVQTAYGVSFPMFSKVDVIGKHAHPLFRHLTEGDEAIHWNFEKFLIDRDGNLQSRFPADMEPRDLVDDIDELI